MYVSVYNKLNWNSSSEISHSNLSSLTPDKYLIFLHFFAGLPYFTDCPEGTTIRLSLPPQANAVHLPITWTAIDHLGNRILLESNVPFNKDGLTFNWTDQSATQKVIFTAIDRWNQEIACKFNVIVEGKKQLL